MEVLSSLRKGTSPVLGAFPVLVLDRVSPHLSRLWDISHIPWDNSPKNKKEGLVNETLEHYSVWVHIMWDTLQVQHPSGAPRGSV
ncbi:MAG: hypothetical protein H5U36_07095 [Candidatus Caldatribacterium sp.]|nr:hypothetical protein [Candidatus Caldatribacterium sp.]